MGVFFGLLAFASLICFVVGLINPASFAFVPFWKSKNKIPTRGNTSLLFLGGFVVLIILGAAFSPDKGGAKTAEGTKPTSETPAPVAKALGSPDQNKFHASLAGFKEKYGQAETEIKKSAVFREMVAFITSHVRGGTVTNWEGKLDKLKTTEGGKEIFLTIESDTDGITVEYKTWNNRLSDMNSGSMIKLNSAVYKQLENLKEGDKVVFNGSFISDAKRGFQQGNMTESSVVRSPEFIIRFSSIKKIE